MASEVAARRVVPVPPRRAQDSARTGGMVTDQARSDLSIAERVLAAEQAVREQRRWLDKIAHVADHEPYAAQWARLCLQEHVGLSRRWRRYLRSQFGADVGRLHFLDPRRVP